MKQSARPARRSKQIAGFGKSRMADLGVETEAGLLALCQDVKESSDRRGRACRAIGFLNPPGSVQALITLASEDETNVAIEAINALSVIKDRKAVRPLMDVVRNSTNEEVKNVAIMCLGHLADKNAESLVCDLLTTAKSEYTRSAAAQALSALARQEQSFEALIAALQDTSAAVRWTAAVTLGNVGDDHAIESLKSRLPDKESVPGLPAEETVSRAAECALQQIAARR